MEKIFEQLLKNDILSEETAKELRESFEAMLTEAVAKKKEEVEIEVRAELAEQFAADKETLIEALDTKVNEYLTKEMGQLHEDIDRFRDLEVEHAEKLTEAKRAMRDELEADLAKLVESLDSFLEIRLTKELAELQEDINEVKKNEFGRKIFEAYASEYIDQYSDDDSAEGSLQETRARLEDSLEELQESEKKIAVLERDKEMGKILSPLSGVQREVMEAILRPIATKDLESGYKKFLPRVMKEAVEKKDDDKKNLDETKKEKEGNVLLEGEDSKDAKKGVRLDGNKGEKPAEKKALTESAQAGIAEAIRLAGV